MEFIREHQLNIMLFMSGICAILAFVTLAASSTSNKKRSILALMEMAAMLLLIFDRYAYIYRGDTSELGSLMVRLSNGLVFFNQIFIPHLVTQYLKVLFCDEGGLRKTPLLLRMNDGLFIAGTLLIVINQFTGLYYTIDENNLYSRSEGFVLAYVIPLMIVILQEITIVQNRKMLSKGVTSALMIAIAIPSVISIVQIFFYGLSLTSISTVFIVIIFYVFALRELIQAVETSRRNEIESYKEAERREAAMFEQTAEALANAIDAKDKYTHGHSTRVAEISEQIAREAGFSEKEAEQVYFSALLHDVGKIGIRDEVINKTGKLTDEEYEHVKQHPVLGYHILSSIKQSETLNVAAHYHHERFDGTGYPEGLKGGEIPPTARIVAVADAYDAMTSSRSYRDKLPASKIKEELTRGMGTQFDPVYARILLKLIEEGRLEIGASNSV